MTDVPREAWDRRRVDAVEAKLDDLVREVHDIHVEVRAAHEQARGAHAQGLKTNGRVSELEHRERVHKAEAERLLKAMFGDDDGSLRDDGGVYGYIKAQRRDLRLLAAWAVVGLPLVMSALLAWVP